MFEVLIGNPSNLSKGYLTPSNWIPYSHPTEKSALSQNTFDDFDEAEAFAQEACNTILKVSYSPKSKATTHKSKFHVQIYDGTTKVAGYSCSPSLEVLSKAELEVAKSRINNEIEKYQKYLNWWIEEGNDWGYSDPNIKSYTKKISKLQTELNCIDKLLKAS